MLDQTAQKPLKGKEIQENPPFVKVYRIPGCTPQFAMIRHHCCAEVVLGLVIDDIGLDGQQSYV